MMLFNAWKIMMRVKKIMKVIQNIDMNILKIFMKIVQMGIYMMIIIERWIYVNVN